MASTYPGTLDTFATASPTNLGDDDSTGRDHAERHDDIGDAMNKAQAELGVNPAGSYATVKARLDAMPGFWNLPMVVNTYERPQPQGSLAAIEVNAWEYALLFVPMRSTTIDRLGINVTGAGASGSVVRLGMRAYDLATNRPGTLLVDGGTVDDTSTGALTVTISQAVTAGTPYVLTATGQGAPATQPTCSVSVHSIPTGPWSLGSATTLTASTTLYAASTTGALPSTQTWVLTASRTPHVWVRAST